MKHYKVIGRVYRKVEVEREVENVKKCEIFAKICKKN